MKVGFLSLLTVLFIGLKLSEIITWNWFWVMAPLLIPWMVIFGIPILIWVVVFLAVVIEDTYLALKRKWRSK